MFSLHYLKKQLDRYHSASDNAELRNDALYRIASHCDIVSAERQLEIAVGGNFSIEEEIKISNYAQAAILGLV
jgi:hypothetical protein